MLLTKQEVSTCFFLFYINFFIQKNLLWTLWLPVTLNDPDQRFERSEINPRSAVSSIIRIQLWLLKKNKIDISLTSCTKIKTVRIIKSILKLYARITVAPDFNHTWWESMRILDNTQIPNVKSIFDQGQTWTRNIYV